MIARVAFMYIKAHVLTSDYGCFSVYMKNPLEPKWKLMICIMKENVPSWWFKWWILIYKNNWYETSPSDMCCYYICLTLSIYMARLIITWAVWFDIAIIWWNEPVGVLLRLHDGASPWLVAGRSLTIGAIRWATVLLGERPETVHGN